MRILITGAGGPAAVSVWKSLHDHHHLVMADMDARASGLYLVPDGQRTLLPRGDATDFCDALLAKCKQHAVDVCISTVDSELAPLARFRPEFESRGIQLPLAPEATLVACREKSLLLQAVEPFGVAVPRSVRWTPNAHWDEFPAFAKPDRGSGSRGLVEIPDPTSLALLPRNGDYVVQELLPGDEYSVDVFAQPETGTSAHVRVVAAVVRERLKTDSGIAVTARTRHIPELQEQARRVVEGLKIPYISNVQFKRNREGQFRFLEVNPRFPGTLPLTALAGIDMPKLLIRCLQGEQLEKTMLPYRETMIVRYWTEQELAPDDYDRLARAV